MEETKKDKDEQEAEALTDLQVSSENSDEVQGGGSVPTFFAYDPNFRGGVSVGGD